MFHFKQSRKLIGSYRKLIPLNSDRGYDVLDFKLYDRVGYKGDLHIHIEKDGTIGVWSNSYELKFDS